MSKGSPVKKLKESEAERIKIEFDRPRPYRWSTGRFMGKAYTEMKENMKFVANRCPKCNEFIWEPKITCGRCKVEANEELEEVPQTGTVVQYTYLVVPMWDPHIGERWANPHPVAIILLDDCGIYHRGFLEETDPEKLKVGMRVKAVWNENYDERGEGTWDVLYFRTIEE